MPEVVVWIESIDLFQMSFPAESIKELAFGGTIGLCVGIVARHANFGFGVGVVVGVATTIFVLFRAAVFDGGMRAGW